MLVFLKWLWDVCVYPILTELGMLVEEPADAELPHVRWIGVGVLSRAPFHAAGIHTAGSKDNTLSLTSSSYAPNIRALSYSREGIQREYLTRKTDSRFLLVAMDDDAVGAKPLHSARDEKKSIQDLTASVSVYTTTLSNPSSSDVLAQLPDHDIVHFVCHGYSDALAPSNSYLVLASSSRLSVEQIIRKNAASAQIAYLSACSTAQFNGSRLDDERIHIASSFQLAGFTHVIGTLWETEDETCRELAGAFYGIVLGEGEGWSGTWKVGRALHCAVESVRRRDRELPLLWAPFVCFGG
jgi:CHAT domain-containing protein